MPNWKKVIVSGSDAALSSLNVTNAVTGSNLLVNSEISSVSASIDYLAVNDKLQGNGSGFQFFAYNEDTVKVKFANWYSSNSRQYGMGQLWYETWIAAIDDQGANQNRRIGFYLEEPSHGASDADGGTGQHPNNARFYVDVDGGYLSGSLDVSGAVTASAFIGDGSALTNLPGGVTGSDTQIQFNDNGELGASSNLVFSGSRLGIGTSTPSEKLEVSGSVKIDKGHLLIDGETHSRLYLQNPGGSGDSFIAWYDSNASYDWYLGQTSENGGINLYNYTQGGNHVQFVNNGETYFSLGNVGIGTTNPAEKLTVEGNISASGDLVVEGDITGSGDIKAEGEIITDEIFRASGNAIRFRKATNSWDAMMMNSNGKLELASGGTNDRGEIYLHADHGSTPRAGVVTFENESQGTSYLFTDTNKRLKFHTSDPGEDDSVGNKVLYDNFPDNVTLNGDLTVGGIVTAQEFHTEFVSASIVYQSGSTKFGDTSDDTHDFTGSLNVSGSISALGAAFTDPVTIYDTDATENPRLSVGRGGTESINFTVDDSTGTIYHRQDEVTGYGHYLDIGNWSNGADGSAVRFFSADRDGAGVSQHMIISSSGNVGIGTTSPAEKLHVVGNSVLGNNFSTVTSYVNKIQTPAVIGTSGGILSIATQGTSVTEGPAILLDGRNMTIGSYDNAEIDSGIRFNHINNTPNSDTVEILAASEVQMIVSASGNVGIGTTSPTEKLDVRGDSFLSGSISLGQASTLGAATITHYTNDYVYIRGGSAGSILSDDNGTNTIQVSGTGNYIAFETNDGSERMRINSSGNVGIGTTSPATKLDVSGSIRMSAPGPVLTANSTNQQSGLRLNVTNLTSGADLIRFQNNGTTLLKVKENGNVGIGNNLTATEKLHISGGNVLIETDSGAELNLLNTSSGVKWQVVSGYNAGFEIGDVTNGRTDAQAPFFISSGAQVGIGTTNPTQQLEVRGGNILASGSNSKVALGTATGIPRIYSNANEDLLLATANQSGSVVYLQDADGRVGIGTSSPQKKLTVAGAVSASYYYGDGSNLTGITTSDGLADILSNNNEAGGNAIDMGSGNITQIGEAQAETFNGTTASLAYVTASAGLFIDTPVTLRDGTSSDLALNFSSSANTGFYITDYSGGPDKQLHIRVNGSNTGTFNQAGITSNANVYTATSGQFRNYAGVWKATTGAAGGDAQFILNGKTIMHLDETDEKVGIGTTTPENKLHLLTSTTDTTQQLLIQNGSTGDAAIKFNISGDTYSLGIDNSDSDKFKLSAGNLGTNDRLVIDSSGNVGIGTSSPTYGLHVNTNAYVNDLAISSAGDLTFIGNALIQTNNNSFILNADSNANGSGFISLKASNVERLKVTTSGATVTGDLTVSGIVTAEEFHTEFVSASIIYESGSTKFGDTSDDNHDFTGTIYVTGSTGNRSTKITDDGFYISRTIASNSYTTKLVANSSDSNDVDLSVRGDIFFKHNADTVTSMTLTETGRAGIGTTSPSEALHVSGAMIIDSGSQATKLDSNRIAVSSTATVIADIDPTVYVGAVIDYTAYNDDKTTGMRTGQLMLAFDESTNVTVSDVTTTDIGDTSGVTFTATNNGSSVRLSYNTPDTSWNIRLFRRLL